MKHELRRFTERAKEEGLLDVAYTTTDSPFGELLLAATPRGLVRVGLPEQEADELLEELAARVSPRVLESPAHLDEARRELDLYGQTRSYMEVAASAGNERAVRAAGSACGSNPIPIVVPCHRVLRTGGGLGGYGGGTAMKRALLELEGSAR
jgi:methylated-DNA-[protein]-cysteine S-methyltransferase